MSWNVYAKAPFNKGQHVLVYAETLSPIEFLARLAQPVSPDGLHKIRHAGLYASASVARRELARTRLGMALPTPRATDWRQQLARLTGRDVGLCPRCGGPLVPVPVARCRDPPHLAA